MDKLSRDFLLGAATAAHQVEGNNTNSDCWAMEHMKNTSYAEPSLDAVDHYNRYEEDIRLMAGAGLNAYRFSVEWARIEPSEGVFDEKEIQHYRKVIDCCLANGLEPIVTLHHFSSPKWIISKGGWEAESVVEDFARYARYVGEQLGDKLHYVCTINEANMGIQVAAIAKRYMIQMMARAAQAAGNPGNDGNAQAGNSAGNGANTQAGGDAGNGASAQAGNSAGNGGNAQAGGDASDGKVQMGINLEKMMAGRAAAAAENKEVFGVEQPQNFTSPRTEAGDLLIMKAHLAAKAALKEVCPGVKVGLTLSLHDVQTAEGGEENARKEWEEEFTHYLPYILEDDFLGVQNYTRTEIGPDGTLPTPEGAELTQMDYEFYPEALEHVIRRVAKEFHGDLIVTENGVATSDDSRRVEFIRRALDGVQNCIADGLPVKGYMYWSLLDNFEWQKGYSMTFGLIAVDRSTQNRYPKESLTYLGSRRQSL